MERSELERLVEQGLGSRTIAKQLGASPTNVRYWLRKHGLKLRQQPFGSGYVPLLRPHKCSVCRETNPDKFYGHKRKICGRCQNVYNTQKGQKNRLRAIDALGGSCRLCGFDKYPCSLDFHHLNPKEKDPKFSSMRGWSWERTLAEIEKCILLCKNCHSAVHSGYLTI